MNQRLYDETRIVIAKLELVSHGTTLNYDSDGRGGPSESKPPVTGHQRAPRKKGDPKALGDTEPEFLTLRRRLRGCRTDRDLKRVKHDAEQELERTKPVASPMEPTQRRYYIIEHGKDRTPTDLAAEFLISEQSVRQLRERYGRDPVTGWEKVA